MPATPIIETDVLIIGGGISGLWTRALLRRAGFSVLLLEHAALATGQTIWSQGIIHGGLKYALTGDASAASKAIAEMPGLWRKCLGGEGEVDLREVTPLSEHQWLWTTTGLLSRLAGLAASKAIRTPVERIDQSDRPAALRDAKGSIDVYKVAEPILPTLAVVKALAASCPGGLLKVQRVTSGVSQTGSVLAHVTTHDGSPLAIRARRCVLAAGPGNQQLLALFGVEAARAPMQRRPLHMVMARAAPADLPELFGHCLSASTLPRITVTTAAAASGERIWWIGGAIAEDGVGSDEPEQVRRAQREVSECLPWLDLSRVHWAAARIDRAEGQSDGGTRPDGPVMRQIGPLSVVWPTKLAFAPRVASMVLDSFRASSFAPAVPMIESIAPPHQVPIAPAPWNDPALHWHAPGAHA